MLVAHAMFTFAAMAVLAVPARAQGISGFGEELRGQFEGSAEKLVALAGAMPAESYSWQPMEGVYTVAAAYMHVARYNYMYPDMYLGVDAPARMEYGSLEERVTTKDEAVRILAASMDHVRAIMDSMSDADLAKQTELYGREVESWAVLLQLVTHMNEHLGQAIAYARMNKVVPPWSR
ncbi:MAG: DinB family protein [Gammaproteobacteria bacterium]|nr:DinB family protein [Gammaproteobacteria bacterium]